MLQKITGKKIYSSQQIQKRRYLGKNPSSLLRTTIEITGMFSIILLDVAG